MPLFAVLGSLMSTGDMLRFAAPLQAHTGAISSSAAIRVNFYPGFGYPMMGGAPVAMPYPAGYGGCGSGCGCGCRRSRSRSPRIIMVPPAGGAYPQQPMVISGGSYMG